MFNGLRFDAENPYTYREGKRLIRLLGDELKARKDLHRELAVDPHGQSRGGITNDDVGVWDFLPLKVARGAPFTKFPHLTIGIRSTCAIAAVTVPNGVCGGFRTKLKNMEPERFLDLIRKIERRTTTRWERQRHRIPGRRIDWWSDRNFRNDDGSSLKRR